jgi:hypothetical protein
MTKFAGKSMCSECSESAPLNTARGALTSLQFKYGGGTGQNDVTRASPSEFT